MWGVADDLISIQIGPSTDKDMICAECAACVHKQALLSIGLGVPSNSLPDKRAMKQCDVVICPPLASGVPHTESVLSKKKAKRNSYDTFFFEGLEIHPREYCTHHRAI